MYHQTLHPPTINPFTIGWIPLGSPARQAYDERLAAQAAGIDQRPLTQKEIVKHLEQFGALSKR